MFGFLFKNRLKVLLRNKVMLFWTLIFPIALGTFFHIAFSGLAENENFKPVEVAIVTNEKYTQDENFQQFIATLSKEDENKILIPTFVSNEEEAKALLTDNKIIGYYIIKDKIEIVVKTNGISQTVMKSIIDNYTQTFSIIKNIAEYHPEALKNDILEILNQKHTYLVDKSSQNVDFTVIYFYTLIGMVCLYGGFFGMDAVNESEANLTKRGARLSVSPTHKLKALLASLSAGMIVQYIVILLLLAYLVFILGIDFGNQILPILFLTFVGSIAGLTLGMVIGSSNKKSKNSKTAIFLITTLSFSFLSGMMMWQMKYLIMEYAPLLAKINPVSMITDALYSLYYYPTLTRYWENIMGLAIFSLVMLGIAYFFIRRKKYDSI